MHLQSLLHQLSNARILVIGDLILDHYIWGDVHRISPEAPVPVVHVSHDTFTPGGAANVALNLANLGVKTSVIGYFAEDEAGLKLQEILNEKDISVFNPATSKTAPSIIKTRVLVRGQQLCRIDREMQRETYRIDTSPNFETVLEEALANVDAVIVSDYAKGVITQPLVDILFKISKSYPKLLVAVDPKPARHLAFREAGLLTPNRSEALQMAGMAPLHTDEPYPLEEICLKIHNLFNPKILIITLGADGMAICHGGKVLEHLSTEAQQVFDVSGAGDTVVATLTAALSVGSTPAQAARLANAAAGCVVRHMGTAPVTLKELQQWLDRSSEVVI